MADHRPRQSRANLIAYTEHLRRLISFAIASEKITGHCGLTMEVSATLLDNLVCTPYSADLISSLLSTHGLSYRTSTFATRLDASASCRGSYGNDYFPIPSWSQAGSWRRAARTRQADRSGQGLSVVPPCAPGCTVVWCGPNWRPPACLLVASVISHP